jgi:hypothetical protein
VILLLIWHLIFGDLVFGICQQKGRNKIEIPQLVAEIFEDFSFGTMDLGWNFI